MSGHETRAEITSAKQDSEVAYVRIIASKSWGALDSHPTIASFPTQALTKHVLRYVVQTRFDDNLCDFQAALCSL